MYFTFDGEGENEIDDPLIVMSGNGLTLHWNEKIKFEVGQEQVKNLAATNQLSLFFSNFKMFKAWMREEKWVKLEGGLTNPATRNDLMTVLANMESLEFRASHLSKMKQSKLRKIMLDIAISQNTGFPAKFSEQCICPEGYEGLSCESCSRGFYRDNYDRAQNGFVGTCKPCDCNGNEKSCNLANDGKLNCVCQDGFKGDKCQHSRGEYINMY